MEIHGVAPKILTLKKYLTVPEEADKVNRMLKGESIVNNADVYCIEDAEAAVAGGVRRADGTEGGADRAEATAVRIG